MAKENLLNDKMWRWPKPNDPQLLIDQDESLQSVDTTDRAAPGNTIMIKMKDLLPDPTNINNYVQTSTKLDEIQNLKKRNVSLPEKGSHPLKFKKALPVFKSISFASGIVDHMVNSTNATVNIEKESPELIKAIQDEDLNLVDFLTKDNPSKRNSVLINTIKMDKVNVLEFLLQDIEDISSISELGETLLHEAANNGSFSCCQYLLSKGMNPGTWDKKEENTPMHCIVRSKSENNKKIFELLMNNGGDINIGLNRSSGSPLNAAVQENNIEMVKYILSLKPDITDSSRSVLLCKLF